MIVGLGVDVVELTRVARMLDRYGERMLQRFFTDAERRYALPRAHRLESLSARIAAKEAGFKALAGSGTARGIGWREIEVLNGSDGAPSLVLHGAANSRAAELGVERVLVTLTHSETTAVAMVILERRD